MNLGETVTYCGLEGVFLCGRVPIWTVSNAFGRRAGFDEDASHIFPQGVLAAMTLVGGGAGDGGARARCEAGPPLCSVASNTLLGVVV